MALGEHLFTLSLSGELLVKDLKLEHDLPDRPEGWRLALQMKVSHLSLAVQLAGQIKCMGHGAILSARRQWICVPDCITEGRSLSYPSDSYSQGPEEIR